jgi:hypothetical protein
MDYLNVSIADALFLLKLRKMVDILLVLAQTQKEIAKENM